MTTSEAFSDRRAFGRKQTYQHAVILLSGRAPIRCIVRDLSAGGASLDFGRPITLPSRFALKWDGSGVTAHCEVRHAWETGVGVQFTSSMESEIGSGAKAATPSSRGSVLRHAPAQEELQSDVDEETETEAAAASASAIPPPLPAWFIAKANPRDVSQMIRSRRVTRAAPERRLVSQPANI